jgi:hypothetical protein
MTDNGGTATEPTADVVDPVLNATVTITVKVEHVHKTWKATGDTSGDPFRLARRLVEAVAGDATVWAIDRVNVDSKV